LCVKTGTFMSQPVSLPTPLRWVASSFGILLLVFFTYLMARIVWQYRHGDTDIDFLLSKQHIIHLWHYKAAFYLHIFPALLVLAAGITQFSDGILRKIPALHRWTGRVYGWSILAVCGPAGFVMALYSNGGWVARTSFITLSILWWITTWKGWQAIRQGQRQQHRVWMLRSYALTFSAVTLRVMQFLLATQTSLEVDTAYQIVAWPSWVLNLALVEGWLRYRRGT
jgi:uncharacterized membrane protein